MADEPKPQKFYVYVNITVAAMVKAHSLEGAVDIAEKAQYSVTCTSPVPITVGHPIVEVEGIWTKGIDDEEED